MIQQVLKEEIYHAAPALSASGAWALANDCPAMYFHTSPFNPDAEPVESNKALDIGSALHLAVLEPDRLEARIVPIDAADWRTKAAKEAREAAYAAGKVPLLPKDEALVGELRAALWRHEWTAALLRGADTEVSFFWDADGIACKARADIISRDGRMADLKTAASASPEFFRREAMTRGHFLRAPWYLQGFEAAGGARSADYWFVVVGKDPPHLVTPIKLGERAIAWGEMMSRRALTLFRICRDRGVWPDYAPGGPITVDLPVGAEYRLADMEAAGAFSEEQIALSMEWLRP